MSYREDFREVQSDAYRTLPKVALWLVVMLLVIYGLGFIATGGDLAIYRFWAPKQENARRQVFENTQSYVQGKVEYISRLKYQYQTAKTPDSKNSLRLLILDEASTVDNTKLPYELQSFVQQLKGEL